MPQVSRLSVVTIISWVLGSGLIAFSITTIYNDYIKQASLDTSIIQTSVNDTSIGIEIHISNSGMETAKNTRLTLEAINSSILEPKLIIQPLYYDEKVTFEELNEPVTQGFSNGNTSTWVIRISNITRGADVGLTTFIMLPNADENTTTLFAYTRFDNGGRGSSYLLGETYAVSYSSTSLFGMLAESFSYITIALAGIAFTSPLIYNAIKRFLDVKNRIKFILLLVSEILMIKSVLENNVMSTKIFSSIIWNSMVPNIKRKIFNEYKDYSKIDDFFAKVTNRDSFLGPDDSSNIMQLDTSDTMDKKPYDKWLLRKLNDRTFHLAMDILEDGVDWTKYALHDKKINLILTIIAITLGSLIVNLVDATIHLSILSAMTQLYPLLVREPTTSNYYGLYYNQFVLSFVVRGVIGFLISLAIVKFHLSSVGGLIIDNDSISRIVITKLGITRLMIYSFVILGVSNAYLHFFDGFWIVYEVDTIMDYIAYNIGYNIRAFIIPNYSNILTPQLFVIEIFRMSLLTYLVQKYIIKHSKKIWQKPMT